MNRFAGRALVAVAGVAIVMAMTCVVEAQRGEGGRGGRGGRGFGGRGFALTTTVRLATAEEVQKALNLTAEQKDKVADINEEFRDKQGELFRQGGDPRETREEAQKLNQESAAKLADVLDETQNKRLLGILAQVDVDAALSNADIAKELGISEDQKEELRDVREANREAFGDAMRDLQDLSREERATKINELRAEEGKKLLAVLDSDQQAKFEALKGEPVKVDMSQFRMGGGRGGRGGRGGEGGREGEGGRGRGGEGGRGESDRGA